MANTFKGAIMDFPNRGIHFLLAEIIKFRKQLTVRKEMASQSGWSDSLNKFMTDQLEHLRNTVENIAYLPAAATQEELELQAVDTSRSLADDYGASSVNTDDILMPVVNSRPVTWDLTGNDLDLPQCSPESHPNDFGRAVITGLDNLFVQATRLDSRHQSQTITQYEGVMLISYLNELYTITQRKGGEQMRTDISTGTLPSQEEQTFQG